MNRLTWILVGVAVAAFLFSPQLTVAGPEKAREWLKKGGSVIDVRSEAEYRQRHLSRTINIPLDRLRDEIARVAPNKEHPLLLHCQSGTRSGKAEALLKKMGYHNIINLGSYGQAEKILSQ